MIHTGQHRSQLIGRHHSQDIPHAIGTRFDLSDHLLYPLGFPDILLHPVEASVPHHKQKEDAPPDRHGRNPRTEPSVSKGVDLLSEVKDLLKVAAESSHHERFPPLSCSLV